MSDLELNGGRIGPYKIERELGRGGMAIIYLAIDTHTAEQVALKVLFPHLAKDRDILRRFKKEGENGLNLRHPNIIQVFESGLADGYHYIALEYAEKGTLAAMMKERGQALPPVEAIDILRRVASALDYAHQNHILHRDIKPSNILITKNDQILLSDFGVARRLAADYTMMTVPGHVVGTPAYMAPEQVRNDIDTDHRSDIYSLGVVAYSMLTKALPFDADNQLSILRKIVDEPPTPPETYNPSIPSGINYALLKVLAKDPQKRYASATEFVAALERGLTWQPAPNDWSTLFRSIAAAPQPATSRPAPPDPKDNDSKPRRRLAIFIAMVGLLIAALLIMMRQPIREFFVGTPAAVALETQTPTVEPPTVTATAIPTATGSSAIAGSVAITASATPEFIPFVLSSYDDPLMNIHLDIPRGWRQLQRNDSLTVESPDRTVWFFLEKIAASEVPSSPKQLLDNFWSSGRSTFQDARIISEQARIVEEGEGYEQKVEASIIGGERYWIHVIAVASGDRNFILGASVAPEQVTKLEILTSAVLDSFALLPVAPNETPTASETPTVTSTSTITPGATSTVTSLPTATATKTAPPTSTSTSTLISTPTATASETSTPLPTATATATATARPTKTATSTATLTVTATATPTFTALPTLTATPTRTPRPTFTATALPTVTATSSATQRPSPTASFTATPTATSTATPTITKSPTSTPDQAATVQSAIRLTLTALPTPTYTATDTPIPTPTQTATRTPLPTATASPTAAAPTLVPTAIQQPPTATKVATPSPTPVQNSIDAIVITLLGPANGATIKDKTEFLWQSNLPLPEGYLFEPAFWQGSGDPITSGRGWGGSTQQTKMNLSPKQFLPGTGSYNWGIRILDAAGKPVRLASDVRVISVEIAGSPAPSGGGNDPAPQPTAIPTPVPIDG